MLVGGIAVFATVWETLEDTVDDSAACPRIEIWQDTKERDEVELRSPREVEEFVAAVQAAAAVAFPDTDEDFRVRRDAQLEMDAAVAECVARAGTPGNRATAAMIRLRNAHEALAATR